MNEETVTIRNKKTGEVRTVKRSELSNYGVSAPSAQLTPTETTAPEMTATQSIFDLFNKLGLSAIPTIAGAGYEAVRAGRTALGAKGLYGSEETGQTIENPFLTEKRMQQIQQKPVETIGRQTAGLAAYGIPGAKFTGKFAPFLAKSAITGAARFGLGETGVPESTIKQVATAAATGAVLEPAVGLVKNFGTYKKLASLESEAADKATQTGANINYDKVYDDAISSRQAKSPVIKKAIQKIWSQYAPSGDIFSPSDALEARRTITDVYGKTLFQSFTETPVSKSETKAAEIVRSAISKNLHEIAPETIVPDKMYSFYKKGGLISGDVPTKLAKVGVGLAGKYGLKQLLQTIFYTGKAGG